MSGAVREGTSLTIGRDGRVLVDADALLASARDLRAAADGLHAADLRLGSTVVRSPAFASPVPEVQALHDALATLRRALHGPAAVAHDVRDLASRTVDAAHAYSLAETGAQAHWRGFVGAFGASAGLPGTGLLGGVAIATAVGDVLLAEARDLLRDPWGTVAPQGRVDFAARLAGTPRRIVADGRAGLVLQLLGGALGTLVGAGPRHLDPVRRFTARVAGLLPSRDVRLVPRTDPPALPAPGGLGGMVDLVARTYDEDTETGEPGTPLATVTVQRLERPDGSVAWVVAIPGTRAAGLASDVPTDNGTNLALEGGVPDVMTGAVLDAMAAAGIGADEPVALVGHSQGGMVATTVAAAAASRYAVRLVVTAGSPDVPAVPPPGVAVVAIRHREDAVTLLDGIVGERGGPGTLSVVRDLAATGGPPAPSFSEAHAVSGYVGTAAMVDETIGDLPADHSVRAALRDVLGDDGAPVAAMTRQYTVTTAPPEVREPPAVGAESTPNPVPSPPDRRVPPPEGFEDWFGARPIVPVPEGFLRRPEPAEVSASNP
ncbi:hypothetical protein LFM56_00925 [Cellulomonas iranensis]|uniref:hypothetical protein n=1 Tax=Cellulomonas iranensis TaxID=76862 RepID=UPI001CF47B92|nr:hypothetical protein [Cellulomonas iranensis]UCN14923.1 hypothetical protein LFM56_00925 [Cellulomonas iranensis]